MLTLYKRGRIWWARGSVHGTFLRRSMDTQFKEVAWQRAIDLELHGGRTARKWSEFEQEFLEWKKLRLAESSRKRYKLTVERLGMYLKEKGIECVDAVGPEVIAAYSLRRQLDAHPTNKRPLTHEGLKYDLRILHGAFSYAVKCGYARKNPIISAGLGTVAGKTIPFTHEEVSRILDHAYVDRSLFRRALVLTFLYTGLRISDVANLEKKAVHLETGSILLRTQKRKKDIWLGMNSDLKHALAEHLRKQNDTQKFSPYVFPTKTGRRIHSQTMDAFLRRIFTRAGIEKGHAHRFRDTFAVRLLEHGASLYDVAKLMGITVAVAERHYTPYVVELQNRGRRLIETLDFVRPKAQLRHRGIKSA